MHSAFSWLQAEKLRRCHGQLLHMDIKSKTTISLEAHKVIKGFIHR